MKKYFLSFVCLLAGVVLFTACSDDDNDGGRPVEGQVVYEGLLILNEGQYASHINGSLDYLDFRTNEVKRNVFETVNGRSLGGTPNNAIEADGKIYIATTDENRVEILDAKTLVATTPVTVPQPRELCSYGGYVYVTSYNGTVTKISKATGKAVATSAVIGDRLEGIAAANNSLYVCNAYLPGENYSYTYHTNVVKLNPETLEKQKDITVNANPNQILAIGSNVYVCSWGNYNDAFELVQQIDAADNVTDIAPATYMAAANNKLYLVASPYYMTTYSVYDTVSKEVKSLTIGSEIFMPYMIAADPKSGDIFVSALKQDPESGYGDYMGGATVVRYKSDGTHVATYDCGTCPGTLLYVNNK